MSSLTSLRVIPALVVAIRDFLIFRGMVEIFTREILFFNF